MFTSLRKLSLLKIILNNRELRIEMPSRNGAKGAIGRDVVILSQHAHFKRRTILRQTRDNRSLLASQSQIARSLRYCELMRTDDELAPSTPDAELDLDIRRFTSRERVELSYRRSSHPLLSPPHPECRECSSFKPEAGIDPDEYARQAREVSLNGIEARFRSRRIALNYPDRRDKIDRSPARSRSSRG